MTETDYSTEEWRDIPGLKGYQVSSMGRIKGLERETPYTGAHAGHVRRTPGKILSTAVSRATGYVMVSIRRDDRRTSLLLHRAVCAAFHGAPPTAKHHAAHENGIRDDNRPNNLRWATPRENNADKFIHGTAPVGQRCWNAKITDRQAVEIREKNKNGVGPSALSKEYGMKISAVECLLAGKTWKHLLPKEEVV